MDIKGLGPVEPNASEVKNLQDEAVTESVKQAFSAPKDESNGQAGAIQSMSKEEVLSLAQEAVDNLNDMMKDFSKDLKFHLFVDGTDFAYVEVINPETNEVVKEIPPEEMVEAMIKIHDAVGMILDKYI